MYQAWPWGGTAAASPNAGFVQPAATGQVAATQWPAGYNQYAVTPDIQQQWAAWATQAQYAYGGTVPVGQVPTPTTTSYAAGVYPEYQTAAVEKKDSQPTETNAQSSTEAPKNSSEENVSKDSSEVDKLTQLKEQAQQWKTLQQPAAAASWSYSTATTGVSTTTVTSTDDLSKAPASTNAAEAALTQNQMDKEEEEFDKQFKDWEKQFEAWKLQNMNHPDKEAFAQYEKQWQEWRAQLLQKKEQMQKDKAARLAAQATQAAVQPGVTSVQQGAASAVQPVTSGMAVNTQASVNVGDAAAASAVTSMYYPANQYMYMQPYMYPGAPTVAPPAVAPQYPFTTPPAIPTTGDNFAGQIPAVAPVDPGSMMPSGSMGNPDMGKGMNDFQPRNDYGRNMREDDMYQKYEGYDGSGNYMPEMDAGFQRDWSQPPPVRGRGRGRGGVRGRGRGRWSDGPESEGMQKNAPNQRPGFPEGPGNYPKGPMGGPGGPPPPPPFEYPNDNYPEEFPPQDAPYGDDAPPRRNFPPEDRFPFKEGPGPFPPEPQPHRTALLPAPPLPFNERYGPDGDRFPPGDRDRFPPERFPPGPERDRFPPGPERDRFPPGPERDRFPPGPERSRFPPGGPERERFPPGGPDRDRFPPGGPERDRFPPGPDGDRFPPGPERDRFPPGPDRDRFPPGGPERDRFPPGGPERERFPPGGPERDRFPPGGPERDRFPHGPERDRFPPGPDRERFPVDPEMFPPGPGGKDGPYDRDFDRFPPDDDMYGPGRPPFRGEFPPFDDRYGGPPGRGRFSTRGRRYPPGEFDRFGPPPFPPGMRDEGPYGPDFLPPDDRFGFPDDGPPRMPPGDGPLPPRDGPRMPPGRGPAPFEPGFGPSGRGRDDRFYGDGPPGRFKTIDYTHRPASAVMGENFNSPYDYESEFQDDVNHYRDMYHSRRERSPLVKDRQDRPFNQERNGEWHGPPNDRDRDRDSYRNRDKDRDRNRDRDRDNQRDRDRDFRNMNRENRDRDRDRERDKWSGDRDSRREREHYKPNDDRHFRWDRNEDNERSYPREDPNLRKENDSKMDSPDFKIQQDTFKHEIPSEVALIEDILLPPKRLTRPKQLVIILRGLPGSGKTYVAKLIKDKEIENGGSAPRILSLDDYFMVESEVVETDPETGKRIKKKEFKFEYESEMEEVYRTSLFKSFKKTIDDRFFPFVIVDAVHEKSKHYEQYWSYAKQRGFQVYIAEMDCIDPVICHKRNIHNRTLEDISRILNNWESKPRHFMGIDIRSLLQDVAITEVEMEVESGDKANAEDKEDSNDNENEDSNSMPFHIPSKWEKLEATEEKLDQLDGLRINKKKPSSLEDYLQLPDDYEERKCEPGKKRVRWADLEERKEQDRLRAIGFVVGQTDWNKMTDPTHADRALTKTKYI